MATFESRRDAVEPPPRVSSARRPGASESSDDDGADGLRSARPMPGGPLPGRAPEPTGTRHGGAPSPGPEPVPRTRSHRPA